MIFDFEPGDKVYNPKNKNWGIGQVQSIIKAQISRQKRLEQADEVIVNDSTFETLQLAVKKLHQQFIAEL